MHLEKVVKSVLALFGALVTAIVIVRILTKGSINLGAGPAGPSFNVGFAG